MGNSAPLLELISVHKSYVEGDQDIAVIKDVSLTVGAGEVTVIHGPSGSGKTTLLCVMAALLSPDRGRVSFEGSDIASLSEREATRYRRSSLGFVFQGFNLIPGMTALDNVVLPLIMRGHSDKDARAEATDLLDRVGLADRATRTPSRLSGGERQRVAVARALVGSPPLVLADEPTGSLDSERGASIMRLLTGLASERSTAVVLVSHDPQALGFADHIYELRDGELTPTSVSTHTPLLAQTADDV